MITLLSGDGTCAVDWKTN